MINLNNSYKVILKDNQNKDYVQFIEADDMDSAISKAKKTYQAKMFELCDKFKGSETQKVCNLSKIKGELMFHFGYGHTTLDCTGKTIFEALEMASRDNITGTATINEITSPLFRD